MMQEKMHKDELEIDEEFVRRLLIEQFPEWARLPLRRVEPDGTVNAIFRLGDEFSVRLARREGPKEPGSREIEWLPKLAPLLPLEVPVPVAEGRPSSGYPWYWEVHEWVDGETVPVDAIDQIQAARDLASFVAALQHVDPDGAPAGRGKPLIELDKAFARGSRPFMAIRGSRKSGSGRSRRPRGTVRLSGLTAISMFETG